jgi:hypothetical protein
MNLAALNTADEIVASFMYLRRWASQEAEKIGVVDLP